MLFFIEYIRYYNNPYKLLLGLNFMDEERYYIAERVKERFGMVDSFNYDVLKQSGEELQVISSKVTKPKNLGIKLENGNILCKDDKYKLKEVTKEQAIKKLIEMQINYSNWQNFMSSSEDMPSSHLTGPGGESLL